MEILRLTSLFNFTAAIICLITTARMYLVIRRGRSESVNIKYYFYALLFVAVYLFIGGFPFIIVEDSYSVAVITAFFRPALLFGGMFLTLIPINLSKIKITESFYFYFVVIIAVFSSILTFMGIKEIGHDFFYKEVGHWIRPDNSFIIYGMLLIGIVFVLSLLFATVFYARLAIKERKDEVVFGKAAMMTIGCFAFLCAGASNYLFGLESINFIITSIIASLFFVMGSVAFTASVNYKGESKFKK